MINFVPYVDRRSPKFQSSRSFIYIFRLYVEIICANFHMIIYANYRNKFSEKISILLIKLLITESQKFNTCIEMNI